MDIDTSDFLALVRERNAGRILAGQMKALAEYMRKAHPELFHTDSGPQHDPFNSVVSYIESCTAQYDLYSQKQQHGGDDDNG